MHVLCVTENFPPIVGGVAAFLHNLCAQLNRFGHHVDILAPVHEGSREADARQPYCVYRYASARRLSSVIPIARTLGLYQQRHYDVVLLGHFMTTHALGVLPLHSLLGTPYAILCHGNDLHYSVGCWTDRLAAYPLFHKASLILCNSRATAKHVREKGYRGPVDILHPGGDTDEFRPGLETSALVRKYNLAGRKVLLSVGRLVERKGYAQVLRALPKVVKTVPDTIYLIAGEGEEETRLRNIVKDLGIGPHVIFAGYVDEVTLPALYCASDLFVMPSFSRDGDHDYEGFGIVFLEANACGKPVIAGRSGGVADAVIAGETGLLVDPHNIDEIAAAIVRLLTDTKYARRLGENGRRRVEKELSWQKVGRRLESYLEATIQKGAM